MQNLYDASSTRLRFLECLGHSSVGNTLYGSPLFILLSPVLLRPIHAPQSFELPSSQKFFGPPQTICVPPESFSLCCNHSFQLFLEESISKAKKILVLLEGLILPPITSQACLPSHQPLKGHLIASPEQSSVSAGTPKSSSTG